MYNSLGQIVFDTPKLANKKIDISFLNSGIYTIIIKHNNKIYKEKFIKK